MSAHESGKKEPEETSGNDHQADGEPHNSFGDEGGTRVGKQSEPRRENLGASGSASAAQNPGKPVNDNTGAGGTGSGSEAARGIHSANKGGDAAKAGSEPLDQREAEHESGYGGKGGAPRTSANQK